MASRLVKLLKVTGITQGTLLLTGVGTGCVPMAPNIALLFVLLGSAVLVREAWPASSARPSAQALLRSE